MTTRAGTRRTRARPVVGPVDILEHEQRAVPVRPGARRTPPGGEEVVAAPASCARRARAGAETGLDPGALVGDRARGRSSVVRSFASRARVVLVLGDAGAHRAPCRRAPSRRRRRHRRGSGRGARRRRRRDRRSTSRTPTPGGTCRSPATPITETRRAAQLLGGGVEQLLDQAQLARSARRTAPRGRSTAPLAAPRRRRAARCQGAVAPPCLSARGSPASS